MLTPKAKLPRITRAEYTKAAEGHRHATIGYTAADQHKVAEHAKHQGATSRNREHLVVI